MEKGDGGPAFPRRRLAYVDGYGDPYVEDGQEGMSVRDYFAGQALAESIAHELRLRESKVDPGQFRYDAIAHGAYAIADAMIAERQKG